MTKQAFDKLKDNLDKSEFNLVNRGMLDTSVGQSFWSKHNNNTDGTDQQQQSEPKKTWRNAFAPGK